MGFAKHLTPPYYAVIFSSMRATVGADGHAGYDRTADRMAELAATQPGFLGKESARGGDGFGITVSYWASTEAIAAWRADAEHRIAQESGKTGWYDDYEVRIAKVERSYAKRSDA